MITENAMPKTIISILLLSLSLLVFSENRALVIGIGAYPEGSGWNTISGDKDVSYVLQTLQANGYRKENITTLVNSAATYNNIKVAIADLAAECSKGDNVYIHYSGHGQRITDFNGDEKTGFDECWIPYDAHLMYEPGQYEGEKHLVDDELNALLYLVRGRIGAKGTLIVVSDACHSGGNTASVNRYDVAASDTVIFRGADRNFTVPLNADTRLKDIPKPQKEDWVAIAACQYFQRNKECVAVRCGSLTYALYLDRDKLRFIGVNSLIPQLKESISAVAKTQTQDPVASGPSAMLYLPIFK